MNFEADDGAQGDKNSIDTSMPVPPLDKICIGSEIFVVELEKNEVTDD